MAWVNYLAHLTYPTVNWTGKTRRGRPGWTLGNLICRAYFLALLRHAERKVKVEPIRDAHTSGNCVVHWTCDLQVRETERGECIGMFSNACWLLETSKVGHLPVRSTSQGPLLWNLHARERINGKTLYNLSRLEGPYDDNSRWKCNFYYLGMWRHGNNTESDRASCWGMLACWPRAHIRRTGCFLWYF